MPIGFQYIQERDMNRQYEDSFVYIPKEKTPYEPLNKSQLAGFEWRGDVDESRQFTPVYALIKSRGTYKTLNKDLWRYVKSSLPTKQEFKDNSIEGDINRKIQTIPNSPFEMIYEKDLEEGKVFSKEIDLKKYFDLRRLDIES